MKKLYKFYKDYYRQGDLSAILIVDEDELKDAVGKEVCMDEVLGKHSEVVYTIDEEDFTPIEIPQDALDSIVAVVGDGTFVGTNPLDYLEED